MYSTDAWAHILRLLHSAQACGVVILLEAALAPLDLALSCESVEGFLGVTPWTGAESAHMYIMPEVSTEIEVLQVWNMPPWVGIGIDGAILKARRICVETE